MTAAGILRRFRGGCIMALRSSFARLLRKQADAGLQLPKQAHSVALVGAPLSRGQVGIAAGPGGGQRAAEEVASGCRGLVSPPVPSVGLAYLAAGGAG